MNATDQAYEARNRTSGGRWTLKSLCRKLAVVLFFLAVTVVSDYPVVPINRIAKEVQFGDATIFSYIVSWGADTWWRRPADYFNIPAFFPHENSLINTDGCILQAICATPFWLSTHNFVLTYNIALYMGTFGALCFCYLGLLTVAGGRKAIAALGAVLFTVNTDRYWHSAGHLNLVWTGCIPAAFAAGYVLMERPSTWSIAAVVGSMLMAALSSWYLLVFGSLAFAAGFSAACVKAWRPPTLRAIGAAILAAAITLAFAFPVIYVYVKAGSGLGGVRNSLAEATSLSASFGAWLLPPNQPGRLQTPLGKLVDPSFGLTTISEDCQFIGYLLLTLLIVEGVRLFLRWRRAEFSSFERLSVFCLLLSTFAFFVSLGPQISIGDTHVPGPYNIMYWLFLKHLVFFRNPSRFAVLFQFFSAIPVCVLLNQTLGSFRWRTIVFVAIAAITVQAEHWPTFFSDRYPAMNRTSYSKYFEDAGVGANEPVVFLPDSMNLHQGFSTYPGWRRLVNGWPGTPSYPEYGEWFHEWESFPTTSGLLTLDRIGVHTIVLETSALIERARKDPRLTIYQTPIWNVAIARIKDPGALVAAENENLRRLSDYIQTRRQAEYGDRLHSKYLDFRRARTGFVLAGYQTTIKQGVDIAVVLTPSKAGFASIFVQTPPFPGGMADRMIVRAGKINTALKIRGKLYWQTVKEPASEQRAIDARSLVDPATPDEQEFIFDFTSNPRWYRDEGIAILRFDFYWDASGGSESFNLEDISFEREKTVPPLPQD